MMKLLQTQLRGGFREAFLLVDNLREYNFAGQTCLKWHSLARLVAEARCDLIPPPFNPVLRRSSKPLAMQNTNLAVQLAVLMAFSPQHVALKDSALTELLVQPLGVAGADRLHHL